MSRFITCNSKIPHEFRGGYRIFLRGGGVVGGTKMARAFGGKFARWIGLENVSNTNFPVKLLN